MAKTTAPLLSFGALGTIAKTAVYSSWRGRPYVRRHVVPANPDTAAQQATRNAFRAANSFWLTAPALVVAPWTRFAQGQVLTDRNAFVGRYVTDNRGQVDLTNITLSPGAKGGLPPTSIAAAAGVGQITVTFTNPAAPSGWTLDGAVAACLKDDDPAAPADFTIVAAEDVAAPLDTVVLGGLDTVLYQVCGWLRWTKPDGSIAYSPSLNDTATPT